MKIIKHGLAESAYTETKRQRIYEDSNAEGDEELVVDDVSDISTAELADTIIAAKEEATDGEETYSDTAAQQLATELKTAAKGFDSAMWAPLDVANELTDALDTCLAAGFVNHHMGTSDGVDILVDGLPGSGKTGIVKKWAQDRGVNLFYLNAKDDDLGANLNGFPTTKTSKDEDGSERTVVTRAFSNALDKLDRPKSVLFLDEFNRAAPKLRAVLLSLINEHVVSGDGDDGFRHFDNLLFTIACINPSVQSDVGAMELNDAEQSRYAMTIIWDSEPEDAIRYLDWYINKQIKEIPKDENYAFLYKKYKSALNIAHALLDDIRFEFDRRKDLDELSEYDFDTKTRPKMLNIRSLTDGLMLAGLSKKQFLNWVDRYTQFSNKRKQMIHDILDNWIEPAITVPNGEDEDQNETTTSQATTPVVAGTDDDLEALLAGEGEETDTGVWSSNVSAPGTRVSASVAAQRIKNYDFTA